MSINLRFWTLPCSASSYEGLKRGDIPDTVAAVHSSASSYEGLKLISLCRASNNIERSASSYEGLKPHFGDYDRASAALFSKFL